MSTPAPGPPPCRSLAGRRPAPGTALLALVAVVVLATACGSAAAKGIAGSPTTSSSSLRPTTPSAAGTVASITGSSMEVQNPRSGQVTVSWTSATTFTEMVTGTASTAVAGACATVVGTASGGTLAARSVTFTQAAPTGSCSSSGAGGFGGFGSAGPPGAGGFAGRGTPPNSGTFPERGTFPRGGTRPPRSSGFQNLAFGVGKVTAVSSGGFTVEGTLHHGGVRPASSGSATTTTTRPRTTSIKVTTGATTTFSQVSSTNSSSLSVGVCVTARGPADRTGAITATAISVRSAGPNGCFGGFGRFGAGGTAPSGGSTTG